MKIISWNINGYRSTKKLGSIDELIKIEKPDIICIQELKMNDKIEDEFKYKSYYNFALKKGYSGVLVLTKEEPIKVIDKLNLKQFDLEGRFLLLEYEDFILINIYIPHGGRNKENHPYKFKAINKLIQLLKSIKDKKVIICTDFNIAHTEKDVKNYKNNYHNNMFSYEERALIDKLLKVGYLDSFRILSDESDIYSMWPNGNNARERNMGWRIDYIFVSKNLSDKVNNVNYLKDIFGSDHCPCMIEIER